jgi:NAD(P)-dependent dehydrogenase (short-subunit alcohol dehydrogenase family)
MVAIHQVREHNAALGGEDAGLVALFTGATRGIGAATLHQLVRCLNKPTIYAVGRSATQFAHQQAELQSLNPGAHIKFIEANITLLREVDRVCQLVAEAEERLDLLFMSPGFIPVNGPDYTDESIDKCMSLSYYGRVRFVSKLVPLLARSRSPRVLSVLAGGAERHLVVDDMELAKSYSMLSAIDHMTSLQTLAFIHMALRHPRICFVHAHPGFVATDILSDAFTTRSSGVFGAIVRFFGWLFILPFVKAFLAISVQESGERQAFHATSRRYMSAVARNTDGMEPRNPELESVNGVYLLSPKGELKANWRLLQRWIGEGYADKVWNHTTGVFENVELRNRQKTSF